MNSKELNGMLSVINVFEIPLALNIDLVFKITSEAVLHFNSTKSNYFE